jgi:hypothetical protein
MKGFFSVCGCCLMQVSHVRSEDLSVEGCSSVTIAEDGKYNDRFIFILEIVRSKLRNIYNNIGFFGS